MKVVCDVRDSEGDIVDEAYGHVDLVSATILRLLDASGGVKLECPPDQRARELLTPGRYIDVWYELDSDLILLGQGVIKKAGISPQGRLGIDASDLAEELVYQNTLFNYQTNGLSVQQTISNLVSDYGWAIEGSGSADSTTVTLSFDRETILKAVLDTVAAAGLHVRVSNRRGRILQVGDFGDDSGVTLFDASYGAGGNEWSGVIEGLTIEEQGDQLANRILPKGGAFGSEPFITLEDASLPGVETITGQDGNLNYYVEDAESVALYGVRWLSINYPDIKPLSASGGDRIAASNQLKRTSDAELAKRSTIRRNYKGKVRGLQTLLLPGQTVTVMYTEPIYQEDGSIWPGGALNETLYVNRVETYAGEGGWWQNVELSNINAQRIDETTDIVVAVERSKKA